MKIAGSLFRFAHVHIFIVSFLLTFSVACFLGFHQALSAARDGFRESLQLSAFLQPTILDADGQKIADSIKAGDPEVQSVAFVSKAQALELAQKDPFLAKSLMLLKDNPLTGEVQVHYSERAWLERPDFGQTLGSIPQIQEIHWNVQARDSFRSVSQWEKWLAQAGGCLLGFFFVWMLAGLYRILSARISFVEVLIALLVGMLGAGGAMALWTFTFKSLGPEAAAIGPRHSSLLPLLTGIIVSVALSGWGKQNEI
jgi:hypothetical protein